MMKAIRFHYRSQRGFYTRLILCLVLLTSTLGLVAPLPAYALNPAAVQVFYVTLPEDQAFDVFDAIYNSTAPIYTYFSIAISVSGTIVYYDHWEDGYAGDIANPTGTEIYSATNLDGVQIWGNGESDDGCAPNITGVAVTCTDANDVLAAGDVIIPYNAVAVPNGSGTIDFDGRDKVGASSSISMARAAWPNTPGTLLAYAHELYATSEWGTAYESPVGTNTANAGQMFEYSALSIMASRNNTNVDIDADADGTYETTVALQEGGSYLATGISQGARVEADKAVQVVLLTGDINASPYSSRDINLLPVSAYGSSHWSPVGVDTTSSGPTRLYLYRPSAGGPTHITCQRRSPTPTTVTQAVSTPRSVVYIDLASNSGAHCYSSDSNGSPTGEPFFGIGTIDALAGIYDWSFTLYPEEFLSTDALVGLGLGKDPTNTTSSENGGPLWVTPVCDTYVYVDWDNNGTADAVDFNGDGDSADTNVDGMNETTSASGFLITTLKSVRLYEPGLDEEEYDQSGARVWSRTAAGAGYGGTPGCNLALAWGQDPNRASAASPGLDVGTSIPPLRLVEGTKSLAFAEGGDTAPVGVLNPGDTVYYNITILNAGSVEVTNVYVYDTVPANTSYVASTTEWKATAAPPWTAIPDDGSGDGFPLDVTGGVLLGNLGAGSTFYVRFQVTLLTGDYEDITNCDTAITDAGTFERCVSTPTATRDWGDLPDSYGTSAAANGPRHSSDGLTLGTMWDLEAGGVPTAGADGDDSATSNDEDGVIDARTPLQWSQGNGGFSVTVTGDSGCLNGWMDFTDDAGTTPPAPDGDFTDSGGGYDTYSTYSEHIIQNLLLSPGTTDVPVSVPLGMNIGPTTSFYFRFRLSPDDGGTCGTDIAPTGFVAGGEVEDYRLELSDPTSVKLSRFTAKGMDESIVVEWETTNELDLLGFNLYRAETEVGERTKLNDDLIPAQNPGSPAGTSYEYTDGSVTEVIEYFYWLEIIEAGGSQTEYGPVRAKAGPQPAYDYDLFLPLVVR